jgi:hypothetical protein
MGYHTCPRGTFGRDAYPLMRQDACQNLAGSSRSGLAIGIYQHPLALLGH